jgi:hypothetical protein
LPQRDDGDRYDHAAAHPGDGRSVQQLPQQYGSKLHDLHDESYGGQHQPVRRLPQRFLYQPRHEGCAGHGIVRRPRADQWRRLHNLPRQRGLNVHQLDGGGSRTCGDRHQLLELPQRDDGDRQYHAASHPDDRDSMQQLPHQYGSELYDLHNEPHGGQRQPVRCLPQRFLHEPRHQRRSGQS